MAESTNTKVIGRAETAQRPEYAPSTQVGVTTYDPPVSWIKAHNPRAGVRERRWAQAHPEKLNSFKGMWVAILGDRLLTSATSVDDVYSFVRAQGHADALIMKVPQSQGKQPYLIA